MGDNPGMTFPKYYNPLSGNYATLTDYQDRFLARAYLAARTRTGIITQADEHYWQYGYGFWIATFANDCAGNNIVTYNSFTDPPDDPTEVPVSVVPGVVIHNNPYLVFQPDS
jgi:hypothetical protein